MTINTLLTLYFPMMVKIYYLIYVGGHGRFGREQVPECWIPSVHLRTISRWVGQTRVLGHWKQNLLGQCPMDDSDSKALVRLNSLSILTLIIKICCQMLQFCVKTVQWRVFSPDKLLHCILFQVLILIYLTFCWFIVTSTRVQRLWRISRKF